MVLGLVEPMRDLPAWSGLTPDSPLHPSHFNPDRCVCACNMHASMHARERLHVHAPSGQDPPSPHHRCTHIQLHAYLSA